jgi:hypothetical protein
MRVFVPATLPMLADLHRSGRLDVGRREVGYAVTPGLRESHVAGDAEELEYAALTEAARASLGLLAVDAQAPPRRVVVALDVRQAEPATSHGRAAVRLTEPVTLDQVAAVHLDDGDAEETVRAAVSALDAAEAGDEQAAQAVEEPEGYELLWFATQEIPDLLSG